MLLIALNDTIEAVCEQLVEVPPLADNLKVYLRLLLMTLLPYPIGHLM